VTGLQLWGSNSLSRVVECHGMRESTSRNQADGSTSQRLQEATKLRSTAAVLPPVSLPKRSSCPGPARCRDWPVPWSRCQFPARRLRESASAPPTDSAHSAPQRRMDSSAEPPSAVPADTGGACQAAAPISAGAMPTVAPPVGTAPWARFSTAYRRAIRCSAGAMRDSSDSSALNRYRRACIQHPTSVIPRWGLKNAS